MRCGKLDILGLTEGGAGDDGLGKRGASSGRVGLGGVGLLMLGVGLLKFEVGVDKIDVGTGMSRLVGGGVGVESVDLGLISKMGGTKSGREGMLSLGLLLYLFIPPGLFLSFCCC